MNKFLQHIAVLRYAQEESRTIRNVALKFKMSNKTVRRYMAAFVEVGYVITHDLKYGTFKISRYYLTGEDKCAPLK